MRISDAPLESSWARRFVAGNRVTTLINGDRIFPPMLEAIRSAAVSITFETFVFATRSARSSVKPCLRPPGAA